MKFVLDRYGYGWDDKYFACFDVVVKNTYDCAHSWGHAQEPNHYTFRRALNRLRKVQSR